MSDSTVVVIGAGLAGLSAACHLAGRGHRVTLLEAGTEPGGRAGVLAVDGYRFDTGPTVLTMPGLLRDTFTAAGVDMDELLTIRPLDPMYRACFADGCTLRIRPGRELMADEIRSVCGAREAAAFHRFCDWLTQLAEVEMSGFIDRNYDSPLDLVRPLGPALRLARLGGFRRLGHAVGRFFADDHLRRIFSFQSLYAGVAPHQALAVYAVITYMDIVGGVSFPEGGMHAVPRALATAACRAGVDIRYSAPVERIVLASGSDGAVRGVRLVGGEMIPASHVVCTADLPVAYSRLLPGLPPPRAARRGRFSPSALVWHAGVAGRPADDVAHHNIHFGQAWRGAFTDLIDRGRCMTDPSTLVTVPTIDDPSMAPAGRSVIYALEPVPNLDGNVDWSTEGGDGDGARRRLKDRVAALGYPSEVEVEASVGPVEWEQQGMARGTPFALAHTFPQSGPFRPANVDRRAPGLVFAGSGTVPGVGVPMVLISGKLAADRVGQPR